ncbi:coiled-coil domain-containing protein 78 isoform X10 [Parus major]|uniref:coiled-coil domain-containing protein 78 isoform X10 n=1 Tax=Parus major TaxID=9157 RepID=UPI0007714328|nr:coiled-coil domain-containing protein 78 isoform X10 [Parus major]
MEPALCQGNPTYRGERAAGKAGWNLLRFWEAGCAELFQQQWWARGEESSAGAALCLQVQLEDRNQDMHQLGDPQEEMGKLPGSKTDFPARMALSEEEKLKISKDLVDLQIETNKMKERYETENFRLKNTMQALERRVQELELCSASVTWERDSLRERLRALESSRQELGEEFIILKSNYLALGRELDQEVMRNEELTQELLSLAKESIHPPGSAHQSSPKLGRGRAAGHPHSARRGKPEDAAASEHEQQELERNLLGNQDHIKVELEKLKKTQDEKQQRLEEQMLVLGKELQEVRGAELCCTVGDRRHRLVEQSAVLLTSQGQLQEVEAENSRLQLQLKELNEEYRSRLARYIRDVANYMDSKPSSVTGHSKAPAGQAAMKNFVESMLKDIRASYKSREEQLARAARGYKKRMKDLAKKHENLLIAYGNPGWSCLQLHIRVLWTPWSCFAHMFLPLKMQGERLIPRWMVWKCRGTTNSSTSQPVPAMLSALLAAWAVGSSRNSCGIKATNSSRTSSLQKLSHLSFAGGQNQQVPVSGTFRSSRTAR